jgi:hypothetical protein
MIDSYPSHFPGSKRKPFLPYEHRDQRPYLSGTLRVTYSLQKTKWRSGNKVGIW